MKVLGVTGGSGSGKTVVCRILKEQGGKIIDADKITRKLQEPGQPVYNEIKEYFGNDIIAADGAIDRRKLGKIIFAEREQRSVLNRIVHTRVSQEIKKRIETYWKQGDVPFVVLDVPIPVEEGFFDTADCIWAVVANDDLRIARLMKRMEISEEEAQRRIAAQMTNREYEEIADVTILNETSVEELKKLVLFELKRFLA
ncbi:MAG: dephospho-CoA kinase [Clostridiales bacterium]|nr:dephospho-CoA kinase [Clostridiales bacterium]